MGVRNLLPLESVAQSGGHTTGLGAGMDQGLHPGPSIYSVALNKSFNHLSPLFLSCKVGMISLYRCGESERQCS